MSEAVPPAPGQRDGDAGGGPPPVPQAVIPVEEGVAVPVLGDASRLGYATWFTPSSLPGRSGNLLIAHDGNDLGGNCPVCNRPGEYVLRKTFSWYPRWLGFLFLPALVFSCMGLLAVWIVILAVTKRASVCCVLCREHHQLRRSRQFWAAVSIMLAIVLASVGFLMAATGRSDWPEFAWAVFLSCVVMLIVGAISLLASDLLKPVKISGKTVRLKGAGQAFLDTLPQVALRD